MGWGVRVTQTQEAGPEMGSVKALSVIPSHGTPSEQHAVNGALSARNEKGAGRRSEVSEVKSGSMRSERR